MFDSIRIKVQDEETAVMLVDGISTRFRSNLVHGSDAWEVQVDGESEDDLPDLLGILRQRLTGAESVNVLVNGENYPLRPRD